VSLVDVMPTILDAEGFEVAEGLDGSSLLSRLEGGAALARDVVFAETSSEKWAEKRAAIAGRWKVVLDLRAGTCALFDLASDPTEQSPLACGSSPEGARLCEAIVARERARAASGEAAGLTEDDHRWLEAIGYLGGGADEGSDAALRGPPSSWPVPESPR
jgi:arylsulfatase A-like enzyme